LLIHSLTQKGKSKKPETAISPSITYMEAGAALAASSSPNRSKDELIAQLTSKVMQLERQLKSNYSSIHSLPHSPTHFLTNQDGSNSPQGASSWIDVGSDSSPPPIPPAQTVFTPPKNSFNSRNNKKIATTPSHKAAAIAAASVTKRQHPISGTN